MGSRKGILLRKIRINCQWVKSWKKRAGGWETTEERVEEKI